MSLFFIFFFFSSRRRHTRFDCDWSSDVCSSDLPCCRSHFSNPGGPMLRRFVLLSLILTAFTAPAFAQQGRSEEHTSELQSQSNLVCRLLLEKKKKKKTK